MNVRSLLAVSLVVNLALAATIAWMLKNKSAGVADVKIAPASQAAKPKSEAVDSLVMPATPAQSFDWRMVESDDYKKYIANLRAIGCPEETIRDIIVADVNKLFESRGHKLGKFQFWKSDNFFASPDRVEKSVDLWNEKRVLLKELLGVEPKERLTDIFAGYHPMESMLDFLSTAKQSQVMEFNTKFQAKMRRAFAGGDDADTAKASEQMRKEMEVELAGILTPQEFEEYQLRMSPTAMSMRSRLAEFDPTEQEFREIFKLQKQFDDDYGELGRESSGQSLQYNTAQKENEARLKSILGGVRYAEYQRATDQAYKEMLRVAERSGLAKDAATKVYDLKSAAEAEASRLRKDESLSAEQRQAALKTIRVETENSIRAVFGETGFQSYQKQAGAYWLKIITPDP